MSRWIDDSKDAEWRALFRGYTKSAYRLEGKQIYSSPAENVELAKFLAGQPLDVDPFPALLDARAQVAAGRTKSRVRVVIEPPTDYTRFELAVYPRLAAVGEDIRIIAVPEGTWPDGLPQQDYWLFDDHDVWHMHYNDDNTFRGAEQLEGEEVIAQHLAWRDLALTQAVPLDEYLASRQTE